MGILPIWLILGPNQPQTLGSEPGKFDGFPGKIDRKGEGAVRKKERKRDGVREEKLVQPNSDPWAKRTWYIAIRVFLHGIRILLLGEREIFSNTKQL